MVMQVCAWSSYHNDQRLMQHSSGCVWLVIQRMHVGRAPGRAPTSPTPAAFCGASSHLLLLRPTHVCHVTAPHAVT